METPKIRKANSSDVKDIIKDKNKIPNLLFLKGKNYKSEFDNIANNRKIKFEISK